MSLFYGIPLYLVEENPDISTIFLNRYKFSIFRNINTCSTMLSRTCRHFFLEYYKRLSENLYFIRKTERRRSIPISSARFKEITKLIYLFAFQTTHLHLSHFVIDPGRFISLTKSTHLHFSPVKMPIK